LTKLIKDTLLAGLYLHIPFCRKLCNYCDFHFTVSLKHKQQLIAALCKELANRSDEAGQDSFGTIYFGGGTPSVLSTGEIARLLEVIYKNYRIEPAPEITFEANPDDLDEEYLDNLKKYTPVNRLSIGIQSFIARDLSFLNRRHTAAEAIQSVEHSKKAGFSNLNIDLIYGIPGMTGKEWQKNLDTFKQLDIPHLSAYHLTIEPKTVFGHYQKKGILKPVNEEISLEQFEILMDFAEQNGYDHYEISNFARLNSYSTHNLGYWTGKPYLGFGPSAHSFSQQHRRWNISNNTAYCESIENGRTDYFETEDIDTNKAYNEYILTSLRTKWGIDTDHILEAFGTEYMESCDKGVQKFIESGILQRNRQRYMLSRKGILIADYVIEELMVVK
jgi:oxygen-independent coproporphyrinogen-3 oxidase